MSVPKSRRSQGELAVITKTKEMTAHTLQITNNENVFPKRYRLTVVNKIINLALDVYTDVYMANEIYPRTLKEYEERMMHQRKAMAGCRTIMSLADIVKPLFKIPDRKIGYWASLVYESRNMIVAWHKKDIERFKDKFVKQ